MITRLDAGEGEELERRCREHHLGFIDRFDRQLEDLAVVRLPSAGPDERGRFVADFGRGDRDARGRWVWLPWERKIVHVLGPTDYFDVITDRNRDKLTRDEQLALRGKRIGVMGLSVGGEAAVTVAQEHLCGTVVLADFDGLDLSNLNRLGAGFDDLGVNKAVLVARRIARIDPYLEVVLFEDGVTQENVSRFLDGLDLLLEECDALHMKYEVRRLAKARGLDVIYAGDERGFLSVEPYGRWPDLELFHGRVKGPPPRREAFETPLEFMRALTEWLGGWDHISERSRSSLERIGATLSGYPQLAGEARFAAGQLSHAARRLLLGERLPPFIGHIDLDQLLPS